MTQKLITVGIDEVGRGCLAGPISACAYAFTDPVASVPGVKDSKKLSPKQRQALRDPLMAAGAHGHGSCSALEIDQIGISGANFLAMHRALVSLHAQSGIPYQRMSVVIDGNVLPKGPLWDMPLGQLNCLVKADDLVPEVSAASILAKVERDALMTNAALDFPGFGWEGNAGYGSAKHMAAIFKDGPSPLHRMSFAPMKQMLANQKIAGQIPQQTGTPGSTRFKP